MSYRQNSASKRQGGYGNPSQGGKNMSNAEYLAMLEQQNQVKRQQEINSKEYQDKQRQLEREKGFNLYNQGANADLPVQNPPTLGVGRKGAKEQLKGARRQWRDPSKSKERESQSRSPTNKIFYSAYQNPFELISKSSMAEKANPGGQHYNVFDDRQAAADQSPVVVQPRVAGHAVRKKWGPSQNQNRPQIEMDQDEDDDYSDDDFIEPVDKTTDKKPQLPSIQENTQESFFDQDYSTIIQDDEAIEVLLKTATAEEMDIIKQSLSNFAEVSKNFTNFAVDRQHKDNEDEAIEEDLEEEIPDDNEPNSSEEEHKFEVVKREQQSKQTTRKGRPVSAVYDLSQFKQSAQTQGQQSQRTLGQGAGSMISASNYQSAKQIPQTIKRESSTKAKIDQSQNDYVPKPFTQLHPTLGQRGSLNPTKPFQQRPVSELKPMRAIETERQLQVPSQDYMTATKQAQTGRNLKQSNYASTVNIPIRDVDNLESSYGAASMLSQKDTELAMIMQAISGLDDDARKSLLAMLKDKKQQNTLGTKSVADMQTRKFEYTAVNNYNSMRAFDLPSENTHSRQIGFTSATSYQNTTKIKEWTRNEFVIRILTTHGDPHLCGLTEIELFDSSGIRVVVVPQNVIIRNSNGQPGLHMSTAALVNGEKFTNEHKNMWIGSMPAPQSPPVYLEVMVYFGKDVELSGCKIWNYNKSVRDSTKGVKDIQLFINEELKFQGVVQMGKGHVHQDYSQIITFNPEIKIEVEKPNLMKEIESQIKTPLSQLQQRKPSIIKEQSPEKQVDNRPVWLQSKLTESQSTRVLAKVEPSEKLNKRQQEQMKTQVEEVKVKDYTKDLFTFDNRAPLHEPKQLFSRPNLIEESLDSFDLFKVTNLGRINADLSKNSKQEPKRRGWGQAQNISEQRQEESKLTITSELASSSQGGKESASRSGYKAPKLMKSPFPEEFAHPSPAVGRKPQSLKRKPAESAKKIEKTLAEQQSRDKLISGLPQDLEDSFEVELNQLALDKAKPDQSKAVKNNEVANVEVEPQNSFQSKIKQFTEPFLMPVLPSGQKLEFTILDTWGDANYLGLTGIEIFDGFGNQVELDGQKDITATPCDINLLMGYGTDPRTVDKLVDGTYFTNDDFHTWLTPFTQGEDHLITITLPSKLKISMIRIWNYNKSRIHSFRGARLLSCHLDNQLIFRGEIAKAPGNTQDPSQCCEILMFTDEEEVLAAIDCNDWLNNIQLTEDTQRDTQESSPEPQRPMTATKRFTEEEVKALQKNLAAKPKSLFDERPQTRAIKRNKSPSVREDEWGMQLESPPIQKIVKTEPIAVAANIKAEGAKGRLLQINITESWGDLFYVGLNGIEFYDTAGERIRIDISNIDATPRDMNSIPGHQQDHRTLDKLINDVNNTSDDKNMWLIPFNSGEDHIIKVDFGKKVNLGSIKFYNYNKSAEDSLRGCKTVIIKLDDELLTSDKGLTLRKAPGQVLLKDNLMRADFGQSVAVPYSEGWKPSEIAPLQKYQILRASQECQPPCLPIGFSFKLNLFSTHGDPYYIGLNGIELFDQTGQLIKISTPHHVTANPAGINKLPGMEHDLRTIDKLFNGLNDTYEEQNMWLAPFKFTRSYAAANSTSQTSDQREPNFVCVMFDAPRAISAIRLWNYSKTPNRGVHEFEIVVDDKPIYRGFARQAPEESGSQRSKADEIATSVVFTPDPQIANRFMHQVHFNTNKQQEVLLVNERKVINQGKARNEKFVFNEQERPQTKYGGFY